VRASSPPARNPGAGAEAVAVTGASRGIGRGIALRLGRDGAAVAVNYVKSKDKADEVVQQIVSAGGKAVAIQADVAVHEQVVRLFDEVGRRGLAPRPRV
jgi:3-oxoacyl-[acyl-carrier protein] reductase